MHSASEQLEPTLVHRSTVALGDSSSHRPRRIPGCADDYLGPCPGPAANEGFCFQPTVTSAAMVVKSWIESAGLLHQAQLPRRPVGISPFGPQYDGQAH